ncbi:hypothetical protein EIP91_007860 [Steccherinum ochraceum]|uniref:DUF4048 domain-containing protein n=1 Tax=Steccherinum ochraceum TaxID=92696 RepID=A0A4R0R9C9_9APHY|nr:hypothetical protein EIP91_007860 [Steccherinum ochraceum]
MSSTEPTTSPTSLPRPLQLLDGNVPSTPTSSASSVLSPTRTSYPLSPALPTPPATGRRPASANPRRQSSISYFPSDHVSIRSPTSPSFSTFRPSVKRSNSLGFKGGDIGPLLLREKGDRRSLGLENSRTAPSSPLVDRGPMTLTEKHADLLQFIAQKESKCLELRSQLAAHEEELAHLKRKWERIVSRGMDRAYTPSFPSTNVPSSSPPTSSHHPSPSLASSLLSPTNGAVLDGIKEGVQGVGRLLAAGLELSGQVPSPGGPTSSVGPGLSGVSRAAMTPALRRAKHEATHSVSSVSTAGTTSTSALSAGTRLSQSSASSFAEAEEDLALLEQDEDRTLQPATHESFEQTLLSEVELSPSTAMKTAKLLRRRSREAPKNLLTSEPASDRQSTASTSAASRKASKRISVDVSASSTFGSAPVSAWMGSVGNTVGKKWEELQKGDTFTKSQKRASLLLSDVSSSFFAALASPSPSSQTSRPSASSPLSNAMSTSPNLATVPFSSTKPSPVPSNGSLLDDDELGGQDARVGQGLGEVLIPVSLSPNPSTSANGTKTAPIPVPTSSVDDDDDWNW